MDSQLFLRVPPEIWNIVFKYVQGDSKSLYNCCNVQAIGNWRSVVSEKITQFMFPMVLPYLRAELSTKDLMTLRAVCKTWKSSVDSTLEEMGSYYPVPSTATYRNVHEPEDEWFGKGKVGTTFSTAQQIDKFISQMKNCNGNPFINKTVKVVENKDTQNTGEERRRLYQKFTNLIENFGHHIWTCVYFADGSTECNRQMKYIFQHLPNIRCLTIRKIYDWAQEDDERYQEILDSLDWLRDTDLWYESLPPLEHLESLNLFLDSQLLCEMLLNRYGSQLYSFQGELNAIEHCPFFNEFPIQRQGIKNLRAIKIIGTYGDSSLLDRISVFHLPHLERLHVNYSEIGRRVSGLKSLLKLINKFPSTLTEIRWPFNLFNLDDTFSVDYGDEDEYQHDMSIQLPHVKWVGIPYSYIGYSILDNILEKFPNLEHLHVMDYDKYYQDLNVEREELNEQARHFLQTVPTLKNITFEEDRSNDIVYQSDGQIAKYRREVSVEYYYASTDNESD